MSKWIPKDKETFFSIALECENLRIDEYVYTGSIFNEKAIEIGNCFRTEQEASEALRKIKRVLRGTD